VEFAAASDVGRYRERNEDAYCACLLPGGAVLLAVADGIGGYRGGEVASRLAIATLERELRAGADGPWGERLQAAIAAAHAAVVTAAAANPDLASMGTTLTAAVLTAGRLYWGHVGDSRAYLIGADGPLQLTADHSPVAELEREGLLGGEEARAHPMRHLLSRALGFDTALPADVGERELAPGEWLVLATDGLTVVVAAEEIAAAAAAAADPAELARALVALAVARGGPDNVTVAVARRGAG
jgi:serine/threonine protein phosphatase PrpC